MSAFASGIADWAKATGIGMNKFVRKVLFDFTRDLVVATPVDTGLARSSWFPGTERVTTVGTEMSKNGEPSITRMASFVANLPASDRYYITNNVVYILALEFNSHSQQAPNGMARITVARWNAALGVR